MAGAATSELPTHSPPHRRANRSTQVFALGGSKPSSIQISYGRFARDVRKCRPSGCRLNPQCSRCKRENPAGRVAGQRRS